MIRFVASRFPARIAYWLFALFLAGVAGLTGLWFAGAAMVRDQIAEVGRNLAGEGGTFAADTLSITGFPFRFEADLGGIVVTGRDARGMWEWRARRAAVRMAPWVSRDVTFDLAGTHSLRFHAGRAPFNLEIEAAAAPGEVKAGNGADVPALVTLSTTGLRAREVTTGSTLAAETGKLQLFGYAGRRTGNTEPAAGMLLELAGVDLPDNVGKYLGPKITRLTAEAQVLSDLPVPVSRQTLARWREAGGSVEVRNLAFEWGPMTVDGSGTLTLDAGLQPEASFAARMTGFEEAADALVAAGVIRPQEAQSVKLLLSLMARRSAPGQAAEIRVPITIQERAIFVGPARLMRVPPIRW